MWDQLDQAGQPITETVCFQNGKCPVANQESVDRYEWVISKR